MPHSSSSRRDILAGAGLLALAGAISPIAARAQAAPKTFVLVHGAWHGGWCWSRVVPLLEKHGHRVYAPSLTGLADRSHLLDAKTNLSTHVSDIVNLIAWEDLKDIVLVGHSYAGFVISGVAERAQASIASIAYLDAFLPDSNQSLADTVASGTPFRTMIVNAVDKGELSLPSPKAVAFEVPEADRAWVDAKCTPQPTATFAERLPLSGARDRIAKRAYIRAKGHPQPGFDQAQATAKEKGWRVYDVPCGHDAMVAMPERVAEILLEVA